MENENKDLGVIESLDVLEEKVDDVESVEEKPAKKPRTQKQIDAFAKVIELRSAKRLERKTEKDIKNEEDKKVLDAKIIKKAIALKKKQIKQQKILDEEDDDDDSIQLQKPKKIVTKKVVSATPIIIEKPKLKISFI